MNFTDALVAALFILSLWQEWRIRSLENSRPPVDPLGEREYETRVERIILRPERQTESDALILWQRMCWGRPHARRYMASRKILSIHHWNEASALLRKVGVHPSTHTHKQGVAAIREAEDRYHKLAEAKSYVPPYGQPY